MTRLIKSFFLTLLISAVVIPVVAQPQRGQRGGDRQQDMQAFRDVPFEVRTEAKIAVFDEYLNLSSSQKEQLSAIESDFDDKRAALREESMGRQRKMLARKDMQSAHQQAIHDMLSKEQYAVFLEKREAIQSDIRQRLRTYTENGNK